MSSAVNIGELKCLASTNPDEYINKFYKLDATDFKSLEHEEIRELIKLLLDCKEKVKALKQKFCDLEEIEKHLRKFFNEQEVEDILNPIKPTNLDMSDLDNTDELTQ